MPQPGQLSLLPIPYLRMPAGDFSLGISLPPSNLHVQSLKVTIFPQNFVPHFDLCGSGIALSLLS